MTVLESVEEVTLVPENKRKGKYSQYILIHYSWTILLDNQQRDGVADQL